MDIKINNNVVMITKKYNYSNSIYECTLLEEAFRVMIDKAFEITRKYKVYSYDMYFYINNNMLNRLCYCKCYDTINNYIKLEDLDLKIKVLHYDFICDGIIELRIVSKDEIKYEDKNDMGDKNKNTSLKLWAANNDWSCELCEIREIGIKPKIKKVIFSGPCTIVLWSDNTKTIVRCEGEDFDKEKGLAMAISKKFLGTNKNKSDYFDIFKEWCKED